uniref:Piercer of microtubule wall 2 n=1 Tax=Rattus norvegicus TaxID=10116 RepID=A0ABK0LBQ3_RAT
MAGETDCDLDKKTSLTSDAEMRPAEPPAPCINPGNPVFSCMLDPKTLHTSTSLSKPQMIMYKTNASQYGAFSPRPYFLPLSWKCQQLNSKDRHRRFRTATSKPCPKTEDSHGPFSVLSFVL